MERGSGAADQLAAKLEADYQRDLQRARDELGVEGWTPALDDAWNEVREAQHRTGMSSAETHAAEIRLHNLKSKEYQS